MLNKDWKSRMDYLSLKKHPKTIPEHFSEDKKINLLVVDDEPAICEVVQQYFQFNGYSCDTATHVKNALDFLNVGPYDLVITDIRMPDLDGTYLLKEIMKNYPDTAVIMMTGVDDIMQAVECLKIGAYDYIPKPFDLDELNVAVDRALERRNLLRERRTYKELLEGKVHERTLELVRAYDEIEKTYQRTLETLVSALDLREKSTAGHSKRSVEYTRLLAQQLKIRGKKIINITRGALLHDVGKIGIPDVILLKPGTFSDDEWKLMRKHPEIGYEMLKDIKFLEGAMDIVLYHHERWDGKGYPKSLKGNNIPIGARIFAVIDAFDAITSKRVYRDARSFEKAREIIWENVDTQFDPDVVEAFSKIPLEKLEIVYQISIIKDINSLSVPKVSI
ncbi:MAG TPA: response regulator [Bacteroidetes bacterium]|nr:response regulator [Bacteroidota bacterium]